MNDDAKLYLIFETLFTQKKYAEYIRYFVENQEQYKRATTLDNEKKLQILNWLAESFVQEKDLVQAKRFFDYLTKVAPTDSRAYLGLINLIKDEKNWQELIGVCQSAQMHCPEMWQSYWWAGHAYKVLKQFDKAKEQFNTLNNQFPNLHQGLQGLTEISYNLKDWQQTIEYGLKFQAKKPDLWQSYWWLGQAYKNLKQYDKAKEQFDILKEKFSNLHQGVWGLTEVAYHKKDWQQVLDNGISFQMKRSDMWQSYWWLGQAYKYLKQYDQAEEQFRYLLTHFPKLHLGFQGFTETSTLQKDWQQVIHYGSQLQEKKPTMWQSYWWLGQAYKNLKQYDKAEEQFNALVEKFPNSSKGREGLEQLAKFKEIHAS